MIFASSGKLLPSEVSKRLYQSIWKYAAEAIDYSTNPREEIPPEWSMYDFCLARIIGDGNLNLEEKFLTLQLVDLLTTFTAVDVRKQSLRHYRTEGGLEVCRHQGNG